MFSQGSEQAPSGEDVRHQAGRAAGIVQDNPLGLALGAAAVGFLVGCCRPRPAWRTRSWA
ncbi:MAG: hypothetical protein DLM67_25275 [Candidatus Nephthysia bennettiae]|nr:MAG: hypothetical protein DLM67_25275 [Candidatus Dormibacteraeota bacterium]